ncbi:MAG: lamin tail domain-containing protein [Patescibacteria group bacterium]
MKRCLMKNFNSRIKSLLTIGAFVFGLFLFILPVKAEWANHVVISEVQIAGQTADDEFIELFNPTDSPIDLTGYVLKKKTSSGGESNLVVSSRFAGKVIQPKSFLLLAPEENYSGTTTPDIMWPKSYNLAPNNTIILYYVTITVDKIGWGTALDFETNPSPNNPDSNQSLERKASQYSTQTTLTIGGSEERSGNGYDTNNNAADFVLQTTPNPQNSLSPAENEPPLSEPPNQGPVCGNGIKEGSEECDGNDLADQTCQSQGFSSGTLSCNSNCTFNTSSCTTSGSNWSGSSSYTPNYQPKPGEVVINEIFPEPDSKKGEEEWIELYNKTDYVLDLSNWTIEDNTGKPKVLSDLVLTIHGYLVLKKGEHFNFSLNNGGDILILKNRETIIDQITYGDFEDGYLLDNAPNPGQSKSIGRDPQSQDTNNDKNDFFLCKNITPGQRNEIEIINQLEQQNTTQQNFSSKPDQFQTDKIFISEFLPNPVGLDTENEWIELYNDSEQTIDLSGWQIDDAEGGSRPYKFPPGSEIGSKKYLILSREQTKITLNNTFDSVRLIKPNGQVLQRIDYQKPPEGASYAKNDSGEWFYTIISTPGLPNIFESVEEEDGETEEKEIKMEKTGEENREAVEVGLNELKNLEKGDKVIIQGTVITPPNLFAKTYFYLNGAQIYSSGGKFPDLKIGDLVEVEGVLSEAFNQKRIKIKEPNQIKILSRSNQILAKQVTLDELNEELVGYLIKVSGQIVEKTGPKIYLDDGDNEVEVYIRPKIEIDKKNLKEGQRLTVTGILVEAKNGWQILPRWQKDLEITETAVTEETPEESAAQKNFEILSPESFEIKDLQSSVANLWPKTVVLKYLLISTASLAIILVGLILKWRGIIR